MKLINTRHDSIAKVVSTSDAECTLPSLAFQLVGHIQHDKGVVEQKRSI